MSSEQEQPIIIVKKFSKHGGHHGGSWKVAFADFMTAMMAFFLVLWLVGQDQKIKEAIAGYFTDPVGFQRGGQPDPGQGPGPMSGQKPSVTRAMALAMVKEQLKKAGEKIMEQLKLSPNFEELKENIIVEMTPEGLRIQLVEGDDSSFFEAGSAKMHPVGEAILTLIAEEIKKLPNRMVFEGHTDASGNANQFGYSNWDLGGDRANFSRKVVTRAGVSPNQIKEVRSYASSELRFADNPNDPRNRRVSILILNDVDYLLEHDLLNDPASATEIAVLDGSTKTGNWNHQNDKNASDKPGNAKKDEIPFVDEAKFVPPEYLQDDSTK